MNKNIKLPFIELKFIILLLPTYLPTIVYQNFFLSKIIGLSRYLILLYCILDLLKRKKRLSLISILLVITYITTSISTFINPDGELLSYIKLVIRSLEIILLFEWGFNINAKLFLKASRNILEIIIYLNLFSIIFFPQGMYLSGAYSTNYIMGYHNTFVRWQIPAIAISCILSFFEKNKITIRTYNLYFVSLLSNLLVKSITGIIGTLTLGIGIVLINNLKRGNHILDKAFSLFSMFVVSLGGSAIIIKAIINIENSLFIQNILKFFHKDITMSARYYIWKSAIDFIKVNSFWGYGHKSADTISLKYIDKVGFGSSAHNFWLDTIYRGGILLLFLTFLVFICVRYQYKDYSYKKIVFIIGLWFLVIGIMGIVEPQNGDYLTVAWIACGNINKLKLRSG